MLLAAAGTSTSAWDQPGTLGFLVVFGMGAILYFVFRSMSRHLKKVNTAALAEAKLQPGAEADNTGDQDRKPDTPADRSAVGPAAGNGSRLGS